MYMNIMYNKSRMRIGKNGEYFYLQPALDKCTLNHRIFAFDMRRTNHTVGKGFLCVTEEEMNKIINDNIFGNHFYEILLPNRPTRVFVDIETENGDYETVKKGSIMFIEMLKMYDNSMPYILLDSSNSKKCSFHIIGGPYFKNPFHVGALIRKITCYIYSALNREDNKQNFDLASLFDKDNNYIVDECVYTMNRQFRLADMCKLGSERVLRGCTWKQSLLQNVCVDSVSECLEIDNGEPISTSRKTKEMFTIIKKFELSNSLIILDKSSKEKIGRSARNIPNLKVTDVNHFSAFDIVKFKKIVFTESSVKELEKRYS